MPASAGERRVALAERRRVPELSPEEMQRELLTSEVTGLPNRRAFGEAGAADAVAMSDVNGLKALNKYGYAVGNAVLKAKADALREAGLEAYHDKG
jgi:GGDEF domain-containing protein